MDDFYVVDTGMIDTDITFNTRTQDWFFVLDGKTYTSANRAVIGIMKEKALAERRRQQQYLVPDDPEQLRRARELDEQWLEEVQKKPPQPTLLTQVEADHWRSVAQAYHDARQAGYDAEETGEILYDLVQQLLSEQGSD